MRREKEGRKGDLREDEEVLVENRVAVLLVRSKESLQVFFGHALTEEERRKQVGEERP
jgi:hypothetical protein